LHFAIIWYIIPFVDNKEHPQMTNRLQNN